MGSALRSFVERLIGALLTLALAMPVVSLGQEYSAKGRDPFLDKAGYMAHEKVLDARGRFYRVPVEDWPAARLRAQDDVDWQRWVTGREASLRRWISTASDHADWVAGWGHDYLSADGQRRVWGPDDEMPSVSDPKLRAAWVYWFRRRNGEAVEEAARLFRLTDDRRYRDFAQQQIDFYADHYIKWSDKRRGGSSKIMGQGLDEAVFLLNLAEAARLMRDDVSAEKWRFWCDSMFRPAGGLILASVGRVSNISLWQLSAAAVLGILSGDVSLYGQAIGGRFGLHQQVQQGILPDYLWFEGSLGYNAYAAQAVVPLLEASVRAGFQDQLIGEMAVLQDMMLAPLQLQFSSGLFPNPGDNTGDVTEATLGALVSARRVLPTRTGLHRSSGLKNWSNLLDPLENVVMPAVAKVRPEKRVVLEASRMALIRSAGWEAFLHWGQNGAAHAQQEALNMELFHNGISLSHDLGTTSYGSPLHAGFFSQAAAHNVPYADDVGQEGWSPGMLDHFDESGLEVSARQSAYNKEVAVLRRISIVGEVLRDEVEIRRLSVPVLAVKGAVTEPASIGLSWNFDCPIHPLLASRLKVGEFPQASGFRYWHPSEQFEAVDKFNFRLDCPHERFEVEVLTAGAFSAYVADVPNLPSGRRFALYLRKMSADGIFQTSIRPVGVERSWVH